jgi:amino acid transporter
MNFEIQNKLTSPRSVGIRFGLYLGIVSIAFFLILIILGISTTEGLGNWSTWILILLLIILAQFNFKDKNGGFLSYAEGVKVGFWTGLISSFISSTFIYVYVKYIDQNFIKSIVAQQIEKMENQGSSDEAIERSMKFLNMIFNPEALLITGLLTTVIGALFLSLLVTLFTQKNYAKSLQNSN